MTIPACFVQHELPRLHALQLATSSNISRAPTCRLEYLDEGGANFVFRILPDHPHTLPSPLDGRLLRVRKDDPHIPSAEDQLQALTESFQTWFAAESLLEHELIALDDGILSALNEYLRRLHRPIHRAKDCMPVQSISGLLVTDMTLRGSEAGMQLKPKWLAQSPTAPPNSRRCRTCALRAYRASERIRTATDAQEICPLDLVGTSLDHRRKAVYAISSDRHIREYLLGHAQALFQQLRTSQMKLDQYGALKTSGQGPINDLCKAMTLRDCSLFVKRSGHSIEARLGDLDLKQAEKLPKWKAVEATLISDGWYTNDEREDVRGRERICLLSRSEP